VFTQPFAVPALLLFIVAIPLILGVIPPNRLYGFRTKKTLSDDGVWSRVNRFAGIAIMLASVVYALAAKTWPYDRAAPDNFSVWLIHLAAFAGSLAVALIVSGLFARRF
jgi:ABC-type Fe3+-siderophore transport system permease subunit